MKSRTKRLKADAASQMNLIVHTVICVFMALTMAGCSQEAADSAKKAGDAAKDAAQNTGETVKGAAEKTGEVVSEGTKKTAEMAQEAGKKLSEGYAAASEKAAATLEGIDGGGEMMTKVKDFFSTAQKTLSGITNKESAQAAVAKLGDLNGMVDSISEMTGKLPEEAQAAVGSMMASGMAMLNALAEKVNAMPGVSDVIKPKLDELMEKLKDLSGN